MPRFKDKYRIIDEIAKGGMAVVYKAEQIPLGRIVAIKHLKREIAKDVEFVKRFEREARILTQLYHRGIARIYEFLEERGEYFIVMEYVEGIPLSKVLRTIGRLNLKQSLTIAIEIARILRFAHFHNIIHRDLKPSNIIITNDGSIKLLDFGVAHIEKTEEVLTSPGVALGTPSYMSPEQLRGDPVSPRSDVFSFGIVLYEMLAGRRPFENDETSTASEKILKGEFTPIRKNVKVPVNIDRFIRKCLASNTSQRYQDFNSVLQILYSMAGRYFGYISEEDVLLNVLRQIDKDFSIKPVRIKKWESKISVINLLPLIKASLSLIFFLALFFYHYSRVMLKVEGKFDKIIVNDRKYKYHSDFSLYINPAYWNKKVYFEVNGKKLERECKIKDRKKITVFVDRNLCK